MTMHGFYGLKTITFHCVAELGYSVFISGIQSKNSLASIVVG